MGTKPTGSISFSLSGANAATRTVVAFTDTKPVSGNADYTSSSFTAIQAGTYRWIASYSGDLNNNAAGPTACADAAEAVEVTKASPALSTDPKSTRLNSRPGRNSPAVFSLTQKKGTTTV